MEFIIITVIEVILVGFAILLIAGLLFEALEPVRAGSPVTAHVLQRDYDGEVNGSGVGPSFGNGMGVAVVSVHENEKWNLIVQSERGVEAIEVDKELWAQVDKGSTVLLTPRIGTWGGSEKSLEVALPKDPVTGRRKVL